MDLLKLMRDVNTLTESFPPEVKVALEVLATHENASNFKFVIPTPGAEAQLNGVTASALSALLQSMEEGQTPTMADLVAGLGGNKKSPRDIGKVRNIVYSGHVPEIEVEKGRRTKYTVRLAAPAAPPPAE